MVAEETAKPHESFTQTFSKAPAAPGREIESPKFSPNVRSFLPNHLAFFNYKGSLTTPPCTEGVRWYMLRQTAPVCQAQVDELRSTLKADDGHGGHVDFNNRATQPLNGRSVHVSGPK